MPAHRLPIALPGQRIGLLGGSFNPAHDGHLQISLEALRRLELDWVWWLVSPQNPLKNMNDTAPLTNRLKAARLQARHPRILVTDLEQKLATQYTIDTVRRLKTRWSQTRFVWLMGADTFPQLPLWKNWKQLMATLPVAVFDRPGYGLKAMSSLTAHRYRNRQWDDSDAQGMLTATAPAWCFIRGLQHPQSSSALRASQ
jgi:nicotinate-nucleotide adenylyltransferase